MLLELWAKKSAAIWRLSCFSLSILHWEFLFCLHDEAIPYVGVLPLTPSVEFHLRGLSVYRFVSVATFNVSPIRPEQDANRRSRPLSVSRSFVGIRVFTKPCFTAS